MVYWPRTAVFAWLGGACLCVWVWGGCTAARLMWIGQRAETRNLHSQATRRAKWARTTDDKSLEQAKNEQQQQQQQTYREENGNSDSSGHAPSS